MVEVISRILFQEGEAQKKSVEEARERIKILEEGLKKHFPNKVIRENGDVGLLYIIIIATFGPHKVFNEAFGVEIIDPVKTPTLDNWIERLQPKCLVIGCWPFSTCIDNSMLQTRNEIKMLV